jgi:Peptidase family M28/PA domain
MKLNPSLLALALLALAPAARPQAVPGAQAHFTDSDTRAWWRLTAQLAGDAMEGRDTGSPAYARAARIVAARFAAAGLKPAGDGGTWLQSVPLHEVRVDAATARVTVVRDRGAEVTLRFLHAVTVRPTDALPARIDAPLVFRGYCSSEEIGDVKGKIAVCFGTRRQGLPSGADRLRNAAAAGAVGVINVDDPGFTIEPPRWPAAYARTVSLRGATQPNPEVAVFNLSPAAFTQMIAGSGRDAAKILADGGAKRPLPGFDIPARLRASLPTTVRDYSSDNVLGMLPGSDPKLAAQVVVVSAHLDGYGHGEPVGGQSIYHGAYDDAAYVSTIVRLAERQRGRGLRRTVLFAAFTGEEKGLLGSTWFTQHPTVAKTDLVADINLDQLRPLFPLKVLTVEGLGETSLGESARAVAKGMGIAVRPDLEPERNLVRRADHWPFLQIGVPAVGFVFGFDPGTPAERIYRQWYRDRYHRPLDSLATPIDPKAARDFNRFFYALTEAAADAPERPVWLAGARLRPVPAP